MTEQQKKEQVNQETETTKEKSNLATCRCGYTRDDVGKIIYVEAKGEWSAWGWFSLLAGVTAVPKRINYICTKCGTQFDTSTDPKVLKQNV